MFIKWVESFNGSKSEIFGIYTVNSLNLPDRSESIGTSMKSFRQ